MKRLFVVCLSALLSITATYAQLTGWSYKKQVSLLNNDASAYVNVEVPMVINTAALVSAGKMKADGSDLRFMNATETQVLSYWIEEGVNTATTKVWVKVPNLAASGQTPIVMYYGNVSAMAMSNGDSTFTFFDDFDGLDSSKWYSYVASGVTLGTGNGKFTYSGAGFANLISKDLGITAPFIVHTKVNGYSAYSWDLIPVGYANGNADYTKVCFFSGVALRKGNGFSFYGSPVSIDATTPVTSTSCLNTYEFVSKVSANGACNISFPTGTASIPSSSSTVNNATKINLGYFYNPANAGGVCSGGREYDQVFVRKYVATEPSVASIGAEILIPSSTWTYKKNLFVKNFDAAVYQNAQVPVLLNTAAMVSAGQMNADGSDIRFKNAAETQMLSYWIEDGTMNTTMTKIWVKVPTLVPSGYTKIVMFYGNASASAMSNGDSTFVFFDNFDTMDSTKWYSAKQASVTATQGTGDGKLTYSGDGYAHLVSKNMGITAPFIVNTKVNGYSAYSWDLCPVGYAKENQNFTRVAFFSGLALRVGNSFADQGNPVSVTPATPVTATSCSTNYEFVSRVYATGKCDITFPTGSATVPASLSGTTDATRVSIGYFYNPGNAGGVCANGRIYDHLFVRNDVITEPVVDSTGTVPQIDSLALNPDSIAIGDTAAMMFVSLTSNTNWTIDTPASWITISALSGSNNASLSILADANTGASRSTVITVHAGSLVRTIWIGQLGHVDSLIFNPDTLYFTSSASGSTVSLLSNTSWTIDTPALWITVSALGGSGNTALGVNVDANTSGVPRSAIITATAGIITRTIYIEQDANVGLADIESMVNISVFPNPSNGTFTIRYGEKEDATATLFDLQGRALKSYKLSSGDVAQADCSNLSNGAYILRVVSENKNKNIRMVIVK
jgi:hypothetical protein